MKGARATNAQVVSARGAVAASRALPEEVPVALVYNGTTQAVMMATPCDLEDFGRGFTLSEGLGAPESIEVVAHPKGIEVQMWLPEDTAEALADRRRAMAGPVGCGLCGIDSLDQAVRAVPSVQKGVSVSPDDVKTAMDALRQGQVLHDKTRAVHGAGLYRPGQGLLAVREDVGRHNALDKLIGAVPDVETGVVVLTSRVSVEMVQKCAQAGASTLFAVSAPTTLAVETAEAANMTLIALARDGMFEVFTHPERLKLTQETKDTPDVA